MDNNTDKEIDTKEILGPEIARFEQYLKYNPKENESQDYITPQLFWKLFYLKHKHLVFWYGGKLYKVRTEPFKLYEVNAQHSSVFLDYNAKDKLIQNITIVVVIFILFGLTRILDGQNAFIIPDRFMVPITFASLFLLYLSFKVPRLIYVLRFRLLKK